MKNPKRKAQTFRLNLTIAWLTGRMAYEADAHGATDAWNGLHKRRAALIDERNQMQGETTLSSGEV